MANTIVLITVIYIYYFSCTVAKVDLDALDDDVITIPECGDLVEKNLIQESYSRCILLNY